jgi:ubiquinone/menaquinone biosynthesis C-methylase UbiE
MRDASFDYDRYALDYRRHRQADPQIAARIDAALGDARTVVNVGAGAGSYEPSDRQVIAVEPSAGMRAERPRELPPAIDASAEALPLDDGSVDAAMAIMTVHHWRDPDAGLRELRRVARGAVVVLAFDVQALAGFWLLQDYVPEGIAATRWRNPTTAAIAVTLGNAVVETIPVPADCTDGFLDAYWARPEAYLDSSVRAAQSFWPHLPDGVEQRALAALAADLASGAWDERHGHLRGEREYDGALRLIVSRPG